MIKINKEECTSCGACIDVCPQDAIKMEDVAIIDQDSCVECGACIDECPQDAITEE
ncbi:MAG TPA: 4Fe-4S binding protein [Candidatus Methanomethylophilaceae archaeon]|nr:4Fe-4S binding protein [Candidatus Methanomethylophilaceae archaeon]